MARSKVKRSQRQPAPERSPAPHRARRLPAWALLAAALVLGCVVHLAAVDNPFVYDDLVTVVGNPSLRDPGNLRAVLLYTPYRPLVNLSYALDYALWRLEPRGYHRTNLVLHLVCVALLWALARRLIVDAARRAPGEQSNGDASATAAGLAALLFAVHPVMTEAVGYVSGRSELLCGALLLAAMLALRAFLVTGRPLWLVVGAGSFAAAAASKEVAAMLPFLLVVWDHLLGPGDSTARGRRLLRFHLPLVALVVAAAAWRLVSYLTVETQGGGISLWHNALTEVVVVWRYLRLLLLPYGQSLVHDVPATVSLADPPVLAAIAGVVLLGWLALRLRQRAPLAVLGVAWFLLLLAPSHVIPLAEAMAEHRTYTPSLGLFVAIGGGLGWGLLRWRQAGRRPRWLATAGVGLVVAALCGLTVVRYRVWADPVSLWSDAASKAPDTWAPQYSLGNALRAAGRCQEAIEPYRAAVAILPDQVEARLNLGICLAETGDPDGAAAEFLAARDLQPDNPKPYNNLGSLLANAGRYSEAREQFRLALRADPGNVQALQMLARLAESVFNDPAGALELCRELLRVAPETPGAADCVARNQQRLGSLQAAAD